MKMLSLKLYSFNKNYAVLDSQIERPSQTAIVNEKQDTFY